MKIAIYCICKAIAEAKKLAEKFSTEILTEELPLQAEFPMQRNDWDESVYEYWEQNKELLLEQHRRLLGISENERL